MTTSRYYKSSFLILNQQKKNRSMFVNKPYINLTQTSNNNCKKQNLEYKENSKHCRHSELFLSHK